MGVKHCLYRIVLAIFLGELQVEYRAKARQPEFGTFTSVLIHAIIGIGSTLGYVGLLSWLAFGAVPVDLVGKYTLQALFVVLTATVVTILSIVYYRTMKPLESLYDRLDAVQKEKLGEWYRRKKRYFWLYAVVGSCWPVVYAVYVFRTY